MKKIGIIAGEGLLPFIMADNARADKCAVFATGFEGHTDPKLAEKVDGFCSIKLGQLSKLISFFQNNDVKKAVFIGRIAHKVIFSDVKLDLRMIKLAATLRDWRTDSILGALADEITRSGIEIIDSTTYLHTCLPQPGILSATKPSKAQLEDVRFGFYIARQLGGLDVGQTVVVKKKSVCALEAIEGTDKAILRGGELGKGKVVIVKVCKPHQDMRFDVPVIGLRTLQTAIEADAAVLAVQAGKTIMVEQKEILELANKHKIVVMAADIDEYDFSDFEQTQTQRIERNT